MYPKTENDKKVFFCGYCSNKRDFSEEEILSITRYNKNVLFKYGQLRNHYTVNLLIFRLVYLLMLFKFVDISFIYFTK